MAESSDQENLVPDENLNTARKIQQNFFDELGDRDYDEFLECRLLKPVIAYAMAGPPTSEGDLAMLESSELQISAIYSDAIEKKVTSVYECISQLSKYSLDGKKIYMSVLYVCCIPIEERSETSSLQDIVDKESNNISVVPVFKIRRCIKNGGFGCSFYVDDIGRLYMNWDDYLNYNKLPERILVVPEGGRYCGTIQDENVFVRLQVGLSPMCSFGAKVQNIGEKAGIVVAASSIGVIGFGALVAPVTPILLTATAIGSFATAVFGFTTSSLRLTDRAKHSQTIDLKDSEARGCWLNIATSTTAAMATGASSLLGRFARDGAEIGKGVQILHDSILVLCVTTGGLGIVNGLASIITKYRETGETPNTLEIFQFTTSIFFFTHSLVNNKLATTIIEESQVNQINFFRREFRSNRLRKIFDKTVAETIRISNDVQSAYTEVIKAMNQINDKNGFFANLQLSNKEFNLNNIKISLERSGKILLNGINLINPETIAAMSPTERASFLSSVERSYVSAKNVKLNLSQTNMNFFTYNNLYQAYYAMKLLINVCPNEFEADSIIDMFLNFSTNMSNLLMEKLIILVKWIIDNITAEIRQEMEALGLRGSSVIKFVIDFLKKNHQNDLASYIEHVNENGTLSDIKCRELLQFFFDYFRKIYEPLSANQQTCQICGGITFYC